MAATRLIEILSIILKEWDDYVLIGSHGFGSWQVEGLFDDDSHGNFEQGALVRLKRNDPSFLQSVQKTSNLLHLSVKATSKVVDHRQTHLCLTGVKSKHYRLVKIFCPLSMFNFCVSNPTRDKKSSTDVDCWQWMRILYCFHLLTRPLPILSRHVTLCSLTFKLVHKYKCHKC